MSSINQFASAGQAFNINRPIEGILTSKESFITHFDTVVKAFLSDQLSVADKNTLETMIVENFPCKVASVSLNQMLFFVAVSLKKVSAMEEIIAKTFVNLDLANKEGVTPLQDACSENRADIAQLLIRECADVNLANKELMTPLMIAVVNGQVEVVRMLLNASDLSKFNKMGMNALHLAALGENPTIFHLLLEAGANPLEVTKSGFSTLHLVCQNPNPLFIKGLLNFVFENNGPSANRIPTHPVPVNHHLPQQPVAGSHKRAAAAELTPGESKRQRGAQYDLTKLQKLIMHKGLDSETALQIACDKGLPEVLGVFLHFIHSRCPELIGVVNKHGASATSSVLQTDNLQVALILHKYGIKLDPALLLYLIERLRFPLAELLIIQNPDAISVLNEDGNTPLIQAIVTEGPEENPEENDFLNFLTQEFFSHTLEMRDSRGYTAFHHAVMENKLKTCQLLLNAGADIDARTADAANEEFTWLHLAVQRMSSNVLDGLLSYIKENSPETFQAFVDKKTTTSQQTALNLSVAKLEGREWATHLLNKGATIDEKSFLYVIRSGHIELVKEFLDRGAVLSDAILEAPEQTLNEVLHSASSGFWHAENLPKDFDFFSHPYQMLTYKHAFSFSNICEKQKAISALLKRENHNPAYFDSMREAYKSFFE